VRLQIYIPGKTAEDLALRAALANLSGQELKELLVLGWQAKNSTTKFSGPEFSTTKPETQVTTGDSGEQKEISTTKSDGGNEAQEFCSRNQIEPQEFSTTNSPPPSEISTTNLDTQGPEPISEELKEGEAAWREMALSGEPPAAPIFQEVEPLDLATLQAITDAGKEVRRRLDEQRKDQGPCPLEEAKKNLVKAQEFWGKKKNGDTSET